MHYKALEKFYQDLPNVTLAKRVALSGIKETMTSLSKSLSQLQKTLDLYENLSEDQKPQGDKFLTQMKSFYDVAKKEYDMIEEKLQTATISLESLVELYDEDKSMVQKPEDFFKKMDDFLELYKSTKNIIIEKRIKQEEERKKKEKKNEITIKVPTPNLLTKPRIPGIIVPPPTLKKKDSKNILSDLESGLRSGRAFQAKRENRLSMRMNEPVL